MKPSETVKCSISIYDFFRRFPDEAAAVGYVVGPVAAMLLDVDLYLPTRVTLDDAWPLVLPGGGIVVDDCAEPHWADGSLEAYRAFIEEHELPFTRVGGKGAGLRKHPRVAETRPGLKRITIS